MKRAIFLGTVMLVLAVSAQAQQVIKSQALTTDTSWNFPGQDVSFERNAVIVTNGYKLEIKCRNLTGNGAEIVSFQNAAASGTNGSDGAPGGHDGSDGGDATHGRNGGSVTIQAAKYVGATNSLRIRLKGEDGGNGGNGGNGTGGTNGGQGDGPDVSDCWFGNCRRAGGNGGDGTDGGNGGYGGRGGDGGDAGDVVLTIGTGADQIGIELHGGAAGAGGKEGAGGAAGRGGEGGNGHLCCGGGRRGADGRVGRPGRPGRNGRNGRGGTVRAINSRGQEIQLQQAFPIKAKAAIQLQQQ